MAKFTSTMQKPFILYRPMLKLTKKINFLAKIFFLPGRFWRFSNGDMKKWDFLNVWVIVGVISFNRIYYIYTSFENLENYLEHAKKNDLDYLLCATCYFKSKKIILEKQVVPFFLQTSDLWPNSVITIFNTLNTRI